MMGTMNQSCSRRIIIRVGLMPSVRDTHIINECSSRRIIIRVGLMPSVRDTHIMNECSSRRIIIRVGLIPSVYKRLGDLGSNKRKSE